MNSIHTVLSPSLVVTEELIVTLTIHTSAPTDSAEYTIELTNEFGSASCSVDIVIEYEPPSFVRPLEDVTTSPGETAALECVYRGLPRPQPTWLVSDVPVEQSEKYHIVSEDYVSRMEIRNVTLDDAEMGYSCRVSNVVGEATTSARLQAQGWWLLLLLIRSYIIAQSRAGDYYSRRCDCFCVNDNLIPCSV